MENIPQISNAEWEVMKVIWDKTPVTAAQVIETLEGKNDWKPKTIKTLIRRLLDKEIIGFTSEGRSYLYHVNIDEKQYIERETNTFLNKIYNGSINHFMLNFVKEKKLSKDEIEELITLLKDRRQ